MQCAVTTALLQFHSHLLLMHRYTQLCWSVQIHTSIIHAKLRRNAAQALPIWLLLGRERNVGGFFFLWLLASCALIVLISSSIVETLDATVDEWIAATYTFALVCLSVSMPRIFLCSDAPAESR